MQVKEAVVRAKGYLEELFKDEGLRELGLEEVEFDESADSWSVTLGFSRPWDSALGAAAGILKPNRSYKVVRIANSDGHPISIKNRELVATR